MHLEVVLYMHLSLSKRVFTWICLKKRLLLLRLTDLSFWLGEEVLGALFRQRCGCLVRAQVLSKAFGDNCGERLSQSTVLCKGKALMH